MNHLPSVKYDSVEFSFAFNNFSIFNEVGKVVAVKSSARAFTVSSERPVSFSFAALSIRYFKLAMPQPESPAVARKLYFSPESDSSPCISLSGFKNTIAGTVLSL